MTSAQLVQSRGIYHGLPTFPADLKGLRAIVAGANGISGHHMLRALAQAPERWSKIYALSRKPPSDTSGLTNVEFISVDFLSGPENIARVLKEKGVQADYVFFFAYLQPAPPPGEPLWSNHQQLCDVNGALLSNTLQALSLAAIRPKRFVLQTGLKNYGAHLGPVDHPFVETAARVPLEPNFYYVQEDILWKWCADNGVSWGITMPSFIVGAVRGAAMNLAYPLAIYASVQAHLKQPLVFPGDYQAWDKEQVQSTAMLNSYMSEWVALTPRAGDQKWNAGDDCPFTWGNLWRAMAGWYGTGWTPPEVDQGKYSEMVLPHVPRGYGPKVVIRYTYLHTEWAQRPEVQQAWRELEEKHGLKQSWFEDIESLFSFTQIAIIHTQPWEFSTSKARTMGWHGFVDTVESIRETIQDMARLGMVPPIPE